MSVLFFLTMCIYIYIDPHKYSLRVIVGIYRYILRRPRVYNIHIRRTYLPITILYLVEEAGEYGLSAAIGKKLGMEKGVYIWSGNEMGTDLNFKDAWCAQVRDAKSGWENLNLSSQKIDRRVLEENSILRNLIIRTHLNFKKH